MRCLFLVATLLFLASSVTDDTWAAPQDSDTKNDAATQSADAIAGKEAPTQEETQDEAQAEEDSADKDDGMKAELEATHQEVDSLKPTLDGQAVALNTFELDAQGNIWACVNLPQQSQRAKLADNDDEKGEGDQGDEGKSDDETANAEASESTAKGYVLVYNADKSLIRKIAVPFTPTAIDLDASNTVYVAGEGKICKMTDQGKILQMAGTPNMEGKDIDQLKKDVLDDYKKQMEQRAETFAKQIETLKEKIAKIEEVEEGERTKRQTAQLKSFQQQLESISQFAEPQNIDPAMAEYLVANKFRVPSLCATGNHVFVTTGAKSGFAFAIWRVDTNFENAKEVIPQVSGCCGQMDVEADEDHFYVADNTKFCVTVYDADGKKVSSFGKRAEKADNGFGSCCNPMNVSCCKNGDTLTAESSIGKIKRFDAEGKLVSYVGRARIGAGCKHVALGYDEQRDRYYIQYQDKNQICILVPNGEASETIAEKKAAQAKLDEAAEPLIGHWVRAELKVKKGQAKDKDEGDEDEEEAEIAIDFENLASQIGALEFAKDGKLTIKPSEKNGFLSGYTSLKWVPEGQEPDGQLSIGVEQDDMITFRVKAKIVSTDEIEVSFGFDGGGGSSKSEKFHREQK